MRIARYLHDGKIRFGQVIGDDIHELDGELFGELKPNGNKIAFDSVKILAPCEPSKIVCVGRNYADHAKEVGGEVPEEPCIFIKPSTAVIAHGENIIYPPMSKRVDYEAEIAVVIGKKAHNIGEREAKDYIFGYTCLNDVTARDLQRKDGQWTRGKGFDTFCPIGPWIETELKTESLLVEARLNGNIVQRGTTADMMFKIPFIVSFISKIMTLLPGDVIATGTPEGISPMQPGDKIEISVEGIGILRNQVSG